MEKQGEIRDQMKKICLNITGRYVPAERHPSILFRQSPDLLYENKTVKYSQELRVSPWKFLDIILTPSVMLPIS